MNHLFLAVFLLLANVSPEIQQAEPEKFTAELQAFYTTVRTLQANFTQNKHSALFHQPLVTEGEFYFEKPEKIRWEQTVPQPNYFIINGDAFIQFDGKKRTEQAKGGMQADLFKSFILNTINGSILQDKDFEHTFERVNNEQKITLVPTNKRLKKRISRIVLHFNVDNLLLNKMMIFESDTDYTEVFFRQQKVNEKINPDKFE